MPIFTELTVEPLYFKPGREIHPDLEGALFKYFLGEHMFHEKGQTVITYEGECEDPVLAGRLVGLYDCVPGDATGQMIAEAKRIVDLRN
jgi:hypothetical protein